MAALRAGSSGSSAAQLSRAAERVDSLWLQGTRTLTEQTEQLWKLPQVDVGEAFRRYVDYLQDGLRLNSDVMLKWFGALTSITDAVRDELQAVTDFQRDHGQAISSWISSETETLLNAAKRQVEQVDRVRQAERNGEEQAGQVDRDTAGAPAG